MGLFYCSAKISDLSQNFAHLLVQEISCRLSLMNLLYHGASIVNKGETTYRWSLDYWVINIPCYCAKLKHWTSLPWPNTWLPGIRRAGQCEIFFWIKNHFSKIIIMISMEKYIFIFKIIQQIPREVVVVNNSSQSKSSGNKILHANDKQINNIFFI